MINITELNQAFTLSKSVREIINKMMDDTGIETEADSSLYYGVLHILDSIILNQQSTINKLAKLESK